MNAAGQTSGVALVTGAARRIGRAIALELASRGWAVAVHYGSSRPEAEAVVAEIRAGGGRADAFAADLSDTTGVAGLIGNAARRLGSVTCLVNNASLFLDDRIETLDVSDWNRQLDVNLRAPVLLAHHFANDLPRGAQGNIINILDQRVLRPTPEHFSYGVAKSGLWAATCMLAQALAPRIRVNGIGPGPVLKSIYQTDTDFAEEVDSTLLGRASGPSEIAGAVCFLLDQPSITGQMIAVDGGQHLAR